MSAMAGASSCTEAFVIGGIFASSTGPIGVDFGSRGVKVLQVCERGQHVHVLGAARIDVPLTELSLPVAPAKGTMARPVPKPAGPASPAIPCAPLPIQADSTFVEKIRSALSVGRFVGRKCVVSLARHDVFVQSIRLPKMPDDELLQTAAWEASQRFGLERQAMEVDFIRTGAMLQGENRDEIILIAAPHEAIHARVEPLLAAGLQPITIEAGFTALARLFGRRFRRSTDREHVRAVVDIGESGSTVMILRGDEIAFCKPFAISGCDFTRAVAEHLQMELPGAAELRAARIGASLSGDLPDSSVSDPSTDRAVFEAVRPIFNELIKEVTLCLRYYGVTFRGHPPDRIILTGGAGCEPHLDEMLAKACKIPVEFDAPIPLQTPLQDQIHSALNRTPGPASSWLTALGCGLRNMGSKRKGREPKTGQSAMKEAA